jgi:hypothetical protein
MIIRRTRVILNIYLLIISLLAKLFINNCVLCVLEIALLVKGAVFGVLALQRLRLGYAMVAVCGSGVRLFSIG